MWEIKCRVAYNGVEFTANKMLDLREFPNGSKVFLTGTGFRETEEILNDKNKFL